MPRKRYYFENEILNYVKNVKTTKDKFLEIATTNEGKLKEYRRLLPEYEIIPKSLDIEEIQSIDPYKVISHKAKSAWEQNGYNPILVEDTSLELLALDRKPGPLIKFFTDTNSKNLICTKWLSNDRRVVVRVLIGIYDGKEIHIHEGIIDGEIALKPRGNNGFGFDDIVIPNGQKGKPKTFAEMTHEQKDKISMRKLAVESFKNSDISLNYSIFLIPEPYSQELSRVRLKELQNKKALEFAYSLESIQNQNKANTKLDASKYDPVLFEENDYYTRFAVNLNSPSIGLILTDVDRSHLKLYKNGNPVLWQMGPERRHLALAQRTEYFLDNQSKNVHKTLNTLHKTNRKDLSRANRRSFALEEALSLNKGHGTPIKALALSEIGYRKISSEKIVSRTNISETGLFNFIGKYPRSIFGIGSMPAISGWRDVITTATIGNMAVFIHRNNLNVVEPDRQLKLLKESIKALNSLNLDKDIQNSIIRNIGIAVGSANPKEEIKYILKVKKETNTNLFRIYGINGDPRVIEIAKLIRKEIGEEAEIFVGQIADKDQALRLIEPDIKADALVFGHGGGRQCTSATNGMAITALEDLYWATTDERFNNTSIIQEGGVGKSLGQLLIMGVDGILYNQQFAHCVIEQGDIYFEHINGGLCHPYHGSASAPTMIIEALNPKVTKNRLSPSGRAKKVEGKSGYMFYEDKANSMVFFVNEFKHFAARTLADLGVESILELRQMLRESNTELLRIVTQGASHIAGAYKNSK